MALWGKTDQADNKPKYLTDDQKDATYGVDPVEAAVLANRAKGIRTPGWVEYTTYVAASGETRNKVNTLVAFSSMSGDASDDLIIPDSNINTDYPVPGSGDYKTAAVALAGITYANVGTPYTPGGFVNSLTAPTTGLWRNKYDGNFTASSSSAPSTWNYSFFDTAPLIKGIRDEYMSWGFQIDGEGLGESLFSAEWKGYIQVPTTQNYNFYAESDDHIAMWIGSAATATPSDATRLLGSNNKSLPGNAGTAGVRGANSVTLTAGKWYPVRIWFSEHTGGCKAQVYGHGADGTKFNLNATNTAYETSTNGF